MNILTELKHIYRFFSQTPDAEKKIVFYAEHEGYYSYFEGLINELTDNRDCTLCYITSDSKDPILKTGNPNIKPFYINSLLSLFMAFVNCRVFVMTLTDLNNFHIRRSSNLNVHYAYVFHSFVSTHMMYLKGAFDNYDSILCCGPHHITEIEKYEQIHKLKPKKLVPAGYYRLERVYNKYQQLQEKNEKTTILVAPSWGEKNILESVGEPLVESLLNCGYNVIVRPHPEAIKRAPALIDGLDRKFSGNQSFKLERSVSTDDSLINADVLICDCSGVALEYALGTERPVLFIDVPYKIRNTDYKELEIEPLELALRKKIGVVLPPERISDVPETIKLLIGNQKQYKESISALRDKLIFNFNTSSEVGVKHILNMSEKPDINASLDK